LSTPTLNDVIRGVCEELIEDIHTSIPAIVESYDSLNQTVVAKVAIDRKLSTGKVIRASTLFNVPYVVPATKESVVFMKPSKGDLVVVFFCERNIDEFLVTGIQTTPLYIHYHEESDGFAIPGMFTKSAPTRKLALKDKFHIAHKDAYISIDDVGNIEIVGTTVKINGIDFNLHTHNYTDVGAPSNPNVTLVPNP
jgi:hypothetical protein